MRLLLGFGGQMTADPSAALRDDSKRDAHQIFRAKKNIKLGW